MKKIAETDYTIQPEFANRWSPRAFEDRPVDDETLQRIFEAARWSPSSMNEQPWRFIVGQKGQGVTYDKIFDSLVEGNQQWAKNAPVLALVIGKKSFTQRDRANPVYQYDAGQSAAYITMQALHEGLFVHQMAGFSADKARELFNIPEDFDPIAAMTIGYIGNPAMLPDNLRERELEERTRRPLSESVFAETWDQTNPLFT